MNIIEGVELKDNFVQMYISSESGEETRILLLLDEYMNEGLRTGKRISNDQVEALKQKEKEARAYQKCIRKLAAHDRSKKELHDWLKKETDYSDELISHVISLLEERGLVNDEHYAEDKITSMKRTLHGEESIVRELREKGIPEDLVREKLAERHSDEAVNASEYAGKIKRTLSGESVSMLKRKLYTKMLQRGFRNDIIEDTIAGMDFSDEASDETENLRKCAIKAKKRYERKYSSSQLRNAVFRYCSTQGYRTEEIYAILDEMEWDDD
jgi:SOS response regulatory protein OraA/RecX